MATVPDQENNVKYFTNDVVFGRAPTFPAGSIADATISNTAAIQYTKVNALMCERREVFAENVTVAALASQYLHCVRGTSGTNVAFQAFIGSVASATDNTITVDLQNTTNGSSAFSSVLSTPILFRSTGNNTIYAPVSGTFASSGTDMVAGDCYRLVVTVAGNTNAQPKGLHVQWFWSETPA